jgi:phenylalanyl-tRNA synthetase alpha chain
MTNSEQSPEYQVEAARKAFEQEFERFARFTAGDLEAAVAEERALGELRTRHLGKKSALAATKKLIGRVAPEQRAAFGQLVQAAEAELVQSLDQAEQSLNDYIQNERTARERHRPMFGRLLLSYFPQRTKGLSR